MTLTEEQIANIKEQLFKQIEKFPDEQRESAKQHIEAMNPKEVEAFLKKNKMMAQQQTGKEPPSCIFCSIINGETPSYRIDENKSAVAVLDINPLSKAHSLIIAKKHETIEKLPASILSLAKKIAKKLKTKFRPEEVKIETSSVQGHGIVNIIPIYKNQKLEKKKAEEKQLQELQEKLRTKTREKKPKRIKSIEELPFAPVRIP